MLMIIKQNLTLKKINFLKLFQILPVLMNSSKFKLKLKIQILILHYHITNQKIIKDFNYLKVFQVNPLFTLKKNKLAKNFLLRLNFWSLLQIIL